MIRWIPALTIMLMIGIFLHALWQRFDPNAVASALIGKPMPAFSLSMPDGTQKLASGDFKGRPVLVNFFASWCGPCAAENATLVTLARDRHVEIEGIALKDSPPALAAYLAARGNPYRAIGMDSAGRTAIDWGVSGVPETFAVDAEGTVRGRHLGELTERDAAQLIDKAGKAP